MKNTTFAKLREIAGSVAHDPVAGRHTGMLIGGRYGEIMEAIERGDSRKEIMKRFRMDGVTCGAYVRAYQAMVRRRTMENEGKGRHHHV